MKGPLLFLLCTILLKTASAQWAPDGAEWYYEYSNLSEVGYVHIFTDGDTVINGQTCKILQKNRYTINVANNEEDTTDLGQEYTYYQNDKVYYYRSGQFFILYDFNAVQNSSWILAGDTAHFAVCDSTSVITVDTTGSMILNNETLAFFRSEYDSTDHWQILGLTIERLGCLTYMFPEPFCVTDLHEGGNLRCYIDPDLGLFQIDPDVSCDTFLRYGKQNISRQEVQVYPNPAQKHIYIKLPPQQQDIYLYIYDPSGKIVVNRPVKNGEALLQVNIASLPSGIYFLDLRLKDGKRATRKFILK